MGEGEEALRQWFGLSYASWLTVPRVMMHAMPDRWQGEMAALMQEFDDTYIYTDHLPLPMVSAREENRFTKWPAWLLNYRHPNICELDKLRRAQEPP